MRVRVVWQYGLLFLACLLILSCLPRGLWPEAAPEPPPAPGGLVLRSFKIEGNKVVKTAAIKKELYTKLPSFWPPWKEPPPFRLADLEYDVERLKAFYRRQGFFHTEIKTEIQYRSKTEADVTLIITEGPWVKVEDIAVQVVGGLDLKELQDRWPLEPGDRFVEASYDDLKNLYLNYLPNHGYPRVKVTGRVELDEDKNTAKVFLTVTPGTLAYFGAARIKDPEKLETPVAAIMEKLTFQPGQLFKLEELFKTQRKLYASDLFKSVVLTPEQVPPEQSTIPVVIELEEKKKRSLKAGIGYGDEDKIRGRLGLRYRNLWGGGRVLDLEGKYSAIEYKFEESFTNPVFLGSQFDLINQTGARHRNLPGFTDRAYYTQTRLERDIPGDWRFYFGQGLEFDTPYDIPVETLIRLQGTQPEQQYRASFAVLGLRRDTVDSHIEPKEGSLVTFANQFAPQFFGSNLQFVQSLLDARKYQAIGKSGFVLAGRVKFGVIQPVQNTTTIPISRLFFSGGANSVRGYRLDYLGPRNIAGDPIGGEAVLEASIEGRFPLPIYKNIGGVVFIDAGNVFLKIHNLDLGQLKYSPGFGLRYLSPIGAVGLDIAFPTNRINYRTDSPYQVHFTIGYGF